jgi:TolB-like protein
MQTRVPGRALVTPAALLLAFNVTILPPAAADQPAIAVLPFANLSGDPAQD